MTQSSPVVFNRIGRQGRDYSAARDLSTPLRSWVNGVEVTTKPKAMPEPPQVKVVLK